MESLLESTDSPEFDTLIQISDDDLAYEDGSQLTKINYLQSEIDGMCSAPLLTVDQEQTYGERLPVQRGLIWDALRQFPAHQGPLAHLSNLPETPEVPLLIRCYRDIKNVMEGAGKANEFREQYGCNLQEAQNAFDALHRLYDRYTEERRAMFLANGRLVVAIARRMQGLGVPLNDLIHDGVEGLLHAIDRFVWSGTRFSTYAFRCIKGKILIGIDLSGRTITVKRHAVSDILTLNRAEALHHARGGTDDDDLCGALGWKPEKLKQVRKWRKHPERIDPQGGDDELALRDLLKSREEAPDAMAIRSDCTRYARELIEAAIIDVMERDMKKGERERCERDLELWKLHHTGEGLTHADIAILTEMSVTKVKSRIGRIGRLIVRKIEKLGRAQQADNS
ncbi:sigma-70 family RNA polymerase sigma factor [Patescibacteria group bacterium]|nr:sigma-70 family RNA polymerase sigma factor [Patescibacteria group bacterium]